jgi:glycosyltransferase involved in cell wall biosynthesis
MQVAVVIPAFNEAATIADIVGRTLRHTETVIVVDDGSRDGTVAALAGLPVTLIENDANLGKAASLARGFAAARERAMDAVMTLDADGQHPPEEIPRLIAAAAEHPGDIIVATRLKGREQMPRSRRFGNWQADFWIAWAAGYPIRARQPFRVRERGAHRGRAHGQLRARRPHRYDLRAQPAGESLPGGSGHLPHREDGRREVDQARTVPTGTPAIFGDTAAPGNRHRRGEKSRYLELNCEGDGSIQCLRME